MNDLLSIKKILYQHCVEDVNRRVGTLQMAMAAAKESANNENKSSAGDKHETSRAMAQLEQEKLSGQLSEIQKQQEVLATISAEKTTEKSALGSLIITNNGNYYLSIGVGKITIEEKVYFAVSAVSPIGKALLHSKAGAMVLFNNQTIMIEKLV